MKKIRSLIVDDEPLARKLIHAYLKELKEIDTIELVGECENGKLAREKLRNGSIDLLFLDIQMPLLNGLDLVRSLEKPPLVIFTTAYENYAVKAFELDVVDYLVKPFSMERFTKACLKAREFFAYRQKEKNESSNFIFLRTAYEWKKFFLDDVLWVEGMKEYVKVQTREDGPFLIYIRMKEMEEKLGQGFLRVHKSHIVNLEKIESIASKEICISGRKIPLGKVYKKALKSYFSV